MSRRVRFARVMTILAKFAVVPFFTVSVRAFCSKLHNGFVRNCSGLEM